MMCFLGYSRFTENVDNWGGGGGGGGVGGGGGGRGGVKDHGSKSTAPTATVSWYTVHIVIY